MSLLDYQEAPKSVYQTKRGQADSDEDRSASSGSSPRTAAAGTSSDSPSPDTELQELLEAPPSREVFLEEHRRRSAAEGRTLALREVLNGVLARTAASR